MKGCLSLEDGKDVLIIVPGFNPDEAWLGQAREIAHYVLSPNWVTAPDDAICALQRVLLATPDARRTILFVSMGVSFDAYLSDYPSISEKFGKVYAYPYRGVHSLRHIPNWLPTSVARWIIRCAPNVRHAAPEQRRMLLYGRARSTVHGAIIESTTDRIVKEVDVVAYHVDSPHGDVASEEFRKILSRL